MTLVRFRGCGELWWVVGLVIMSIIFKAAKRSTEAIEDCRSIIEAFRRVVMRKTRLWLMCSEVVDVFWKL